jgi:hypothetical protein
VRSLAEFEEAVSSARRVLALNLLRGNTQIFLLLR